MGKRLNAISAERDLIDLDVEFRRIARRTSQLHVRRKSPLEASRRWSDTIDAGLKVAGLIKAAPARDIAGLARKSRAILWRIRVDEDVILDAILVRALRRLAREVAHLAR